MEEPFRRPWEVRVTWQKGLEGTTGWGGGSVDAVPSFCGPDLLGQALSSQAEVGGPATVLGVTGLP